MRKGHEFLNLELFFKNIFLLIIGFMNLQLQCKVVILSRSSAREIVCIANFDKS